MIQPMTEKGGRPSSFNEETIDRVLEGIRQGLSYAQAAAYAGISYSTLNRWRIIGQQEDAEPEFRKFWKAFQQANGEASFRLLGNINDAANRGDWKAAGWILERRFPEQWSNRTPPPRDPTEPLMPM